MSLLARLGALGRAGRGKAAPGNVGASIIV